MLEKMGVIGTDEAARRLGISIGRLTTMIRTNIINAQKIGRTWVLDEVEVQRVSALSRKRGRPKKKP
jgi:excisionase family DNA binding protein